MTYKSIVRKGWQKRHPDEGYDDRFAFPDAVEIIDFPGTRGMVVERVKTFDKITYKDIVAAGLKDHPYARTILAKDRSIGDAYAY